MQASKALLASHQLDKETERERETEELVLNSGSLDLCPSLKYRQERSGVSGLDDRGPNQWTELQAPRTIKEACEVGVVQGRMSDRVKWGGAGRGPEGSSEFAHFPNYSFVVPIVLRLAS